MYPAYLFLKSLFRPTETDTTYTPPISLSPLEKPENPIIFLATVPSPSRILSLLSNLRSRIIDAICFLYYFQNV